MIGQHGPLGASNRDHLISNRSGPLEVYQARTAYSRIRPAGTHCVGNRRGAHDIWQSVARPTAGAPLRWRQSVDTTYGIRPDGEAAKVTRFAGCSPSSKSWDNGSRMASAASSKPTPCFAVLLAALASSHSKSPCTTVGANAN